MCECVCFVVLGELEVHIHFVVIYIVFNSPVALRTDNVNCLWAYVCAYAFFVAHQLNESYVNIGWKSDCVICARAFVAYAVVAVVVTYDMRTSVIFNKIIQCFLYLPDKKIIFCCC